MKWLAVVWLLLCAGLAPAQVLGPTLSIDTPVIGPAGGRQLSPAVAFTGDGYFVAWADQRDGRTWDLWYRRLGPDGEGLTPLSLPLVRGPAQQQGPALAAGPSEVLVAWLDDSACNSEVRAQRFSFDGQPQGPVLALSTGACTTERPSVAWDAPSARWLVAWGAHGAGREVHGALVAADGTLALSDFVIASGANGARTPWVASVGGQFAVAWADDRTVLNTPNAYLTFVTGTGAVALAVPVAPLASAQTAPCVALSGSGTDVLVSWLEGPNVRATYVPVVGPAPAAPFTVTTGTPQQLSCERGPNGTVVLMPVHQRSAGNGVFLHVVRPGGVVSAEFSAAPRVSYFSREQPRLAASGATGLLVVRGPRGFVTDEDILARPLLLADDGADGGALVVVATAGTHLSRANAAFDGTRYLTVWRDDGQSTAGSDSFGQLLEAGTGLPLLDGGLRLSVNSANLVSYPSVGGAPTGGFFVSWGDDNSAGALRGKLVSSTGLVGPMLNLSDVSSYVFAHASRWLDDGWATTSIKNGNVHLRRTSVSGAPVLTETVLGPVGSTLDSNGSATLDGLLLAVFLGRDAGTDVRGLRYAVDAGVLDPQGFVIAGGPGDQLDPAVGAGASLFLAAWSQDAGIFATRVTPQGTLLDVPPLTLAPPASASFVPRVGWTGRHFLVAWQQAGDVVGLRLAEDGGVVDAAPLVFAADPELEREPFVASGPSGEALVTWEAFELPWGSFRVRGRVFADPAPGGPDAGPADGGADAGGAPEPDAGTPLDGGLSDAGVADAGLSDAGVADAGLSDAGVADAGLSPADAGTLDGGADQGADAGVLPPRALAVGCGCQAVDLLALLGLLPWLRRRRLSAAARS